MDAVRVAGITKSEFARRIGKDEKEARPILDPKHPTKFATLAEALRKLGQRLFIGVEPAGRSVTRRLELRGIAHLHVALPVARRAATTLPPFS